MAFSKFNAKPTIVDSIRFASRAEARRYSELKNLERVGLISHMERQPKFPLVVNGQVVCYYIADFRYLDRTTGKSVTEDVKGHKTPEYKLKRKLLLALQPGIDHREVTAQGRKAPDAKSREIQEVFREHTRRRA